MPQLLDLIDKSDRAGARGRSVAEEAADLLGNLHRAERGHAEDLVPTRGARPSFDSLRGEYRAMFDRCRVEPRYRSNVDEHVEFLQRFRPRYENVGTALEMPWYFIGIIHSLEAGFNFRTHLHNGGSLSRRTVLVPKNRPEIWSPPNDRESSADDALRIKSFHEHKNWSLEQMLYRWELYNGFGYRNKRDSEGRLVYSPCLWSFSDQYRRGKYVRDGVWDPSYVSQQCSACAMLKALITGGHVASL